jgi:hypothetical protein
MSLFTVLLYIAGNDDNAAAGGATVAGREFPALGFDPAPGDPAALGSAADDVNGAGTVFATASGNVTRLNSAGWTGDAADAFRGQLKDLPRDLDLAAHSHQTAARALSDYRSGLVTRQRRASDLESRAADLRRQESAAVSEVNRLAGQSAPSGSAEFQQLKNRYDAARTHANAVSGDLQDVIAQARRLLDEHRSAASDAAGKINGVADAPYKEPGWLSRAWSSVKGWIADHVDVLEKISSVLKGISAVLGVLSLVPGLQFLAPFAIAAGGIALAIEVAVTVATGRGSWASIGLDAALTFLPVGKVAGLVKKIPGVSRAAAAAGRAIWGRGLAPGAMRFGKMMTFTDEAGQVTARGTRVTAHLDPASLPASGTRATRRIPASIRPAGYRGAAGPHAKGHLLADTLGGPHDDPANFVTLFHGAGPRINNGPMADVEMQVRRVVQGTEPGVPAQNVIYRTVARGSKELPDAVDILAIGAKGWVKQIRLPNL